jgi:hypothetical protein
MTSFSLPRDLEGELPAQTIQTHAARDYAVPMSDPIVILTEEPLGSDDRVNISRLVDAGDTPLVVLVPANTERHLLVDFLENLSMLEVAKAFRELTASAPDPAVKRAEAAEALSTSLAALEGLGGGVTGEVVEGDAVAGLVSKVKELGAGQAVVITRPHAIADTFHTDWANKAQDQLGLPVLHLYAGSGFIGDS